ncbi:MAG: prepilin-type N-terminal cleavage/methylation domain-containing protein, partial [Candidatus Omnitrophica bacterium]|nr:prepilin-type N-terminal cleavage/methylation domain-containing protein [Candidatus Omnitrophota bacterium]
RGGSILHRGSGSLTMKKGLTLVEIIASTVILGIVVAGLAGMFVMGKRYIIHSRSRLTSGELARYFLDPLQMNVTQGTWGDGATNCLSNPDGCRDSVPIDRTSYNSTYHNQDITISGVPDFHLRSVNLTINWTEVSPGS